jgi:tRNA(fMet)-specific endonuclease VapC
MFLLDTDHIGIIQGRTMPEFQRLWHRMQKHDASSFFVPIISFHEQVLGWNAYLSRANGSAGVVRAYQMFERILADFSASQLRSFDGPAAAIFDSFRAQGIRSATMDLRIAAIAVANNLTVLTRNLADFRRIPGAQVEDWTV